MFTDIRWRADLVVLEDVMVRYKFFSRERHGKLPGLRTELDTQMHIWTTRLLVSLTSGGRGIGSMGI